MAVSFVRSARWLNCIFQNVFEQQQQQANWFASDTSCNLQMSRPFAACLVMSLDCGEADCLRDLQMNFMSDFATDNRRVIYLLFSSLEENRKC